MGLKFHPFSRGSLNLIEWIGRGYRSYFQNKGLANDSVLHTIRKSSVLEYIHSHCVAINS